MELAPALEKIEVTPMNSIDSHGAYDFGYPLF